GILEMARGRYHDGLSRLHSAEQLAQGLATRHVLALRARSLELQTLIRMGHQERVERVLVEMDHADRDSAEIRAAVATLCLAQNDPQAAMSLLAPLLGRLSEILDLVAGKTPRMAAGEPQPLRDPLTESETRVLRYLPTNLSSPEIATELHLSANTVKTHVRHLYDKLGAHSRREAV